jgi:hypothetical protein
MMTTSTAAHAHDSKGRTIEDSKTPLQGQEASTLLAAVDRMYADPGAHCFDIVDNSVGGSSGEAGKTAGGMAGLKDVEEYAEFMDVSSRVTWKAEKAVAVRATHALHSVRHLESGGGGAVVVRLKYECKVCTGNGAAGCRSATPVYRDLVLMLETTSEDDDAIIDQFDSTVAKAHAAANAAADAEANTVAAKAKQVLRGGKQGAGTADAGWPGWNALEAEVAGLTGVLTGDEDIGKQEAKRAKATETKEAKGAKEAKEAKETKATAASQSFVTRAEKVQSQCAMFLNIYASALSCPLSHLSPSSRISRIYTSCLSSTLALPPTHHSPPCSQDESRARSCV